MSDTRRGESPAHPARPARGALPVEHHEDGTGAPRRAARAEAGMATAEYAIGTVAAAAFAGLLLVILRGDGVRAALEGLIQQALSVG